MKRCYYIPDKNDFFNLNKEKIGQKFENQNLNKYLEEKISWSDYRGYYNASNHNRLKLEKIISILKNLLFHEGKMIKIPRGDDNPYYMETNYPDFHNYLEKINKDLIQHEMHYTMNSIKKNTFPDLSRMNLIERYSFIKESQQWKKLNPFKRAPIDGLKISKWGIEFLNLKTQEQKQDYLYNIEKRRHNRLINIIYEVLTLLEKKERYITLWEYQIFLTSWCGFGGNQENILTPKDIVNYIKIFRSSGQMRRKGFIQILKQIGNRKKQEKVSKIYKFDFNNWVNACNQILEWLDLIWIFTFDKNNQRIILPGLDDTINSKNNFKSTRNPRIKKEYCRENNIKNKKIGYEFHHIIPIAFATNCRQLKMIDDWRNIIYVDGKTHAIFTQKNNCYTIINNINYEKKEIIFQSYIDENDKFTLKIGEESNSKIFIKKKNLEELKRYNEGIRDVL